MNNSKDMKLYNVLFPLWMLMFFPITWIVVLPGNFLIDSAVLLIALKVFKVTEIKEWYKKYILKIFIFGLVADVIGCAWMLLMVILEIGNMGDEFYITIPAMLISCVMIYVFNFFITFKKVENPLRKKLALTFAIATAPITFLVPSAWLYGF